ncbi:DUF2163 domain-containing protein [Ketogulonicigenium vulgare]|uniref:Putative gene transfer agent protein n=1 Tax=Ketogulonicigenium vulgare (strain WSH-001) TaxID=759362 RepID=F9Y465_KETVW|nr:DUF2163 domain-containing protein [Ketogulonicigenium vulgare]ADO42307.1 phage protein [Ketogulonicigenium vulgare Y25]AEM40501.1 putative gene transfer agent protein [Ketogulonicigenium vulgare WSH-001]ALJ80686.1 hypothetical protein KVH_05525 [Ketogulonicigenium vulgare]ANW33493.1 hypothetical protein KvSKV_05495 [Ketogulonicigenium vulgare]AOZ54218.1 phage protein [Ketogulonicigenium vulgare]
MSDHSTTRCTAWAITRTDGLQLGFTDHDGDLTFAGLTFRAGAGMSGAALVQGAGLAVDNTEGFGMITDDAVGEGDLRAGRFDGADIRIYQVNWRAPADRSLIFHGTLGEITLEDGAWRAELRGAAEALSRPIGRSYQRGCAAVLGDAACGFDLDTPGFAMDAALIAVDDTTLTIAAPDLDPRWFERGVVKITTGAAAGLSGMIKSDASLGAQRLISLWSPLGVQPQAGDQIRLLPGCDKRLATCRAKFGNLHNFRGFPHIPGEDWLIAAPKTNGSGESLFR